MRFAWQKKNSDDHASKHEFTLPLALIRMAYNIAFWAFLLPFITTMNFRTGFILFAIIILVRLSANLYVNALKLTPAQYDSFPFRS